MIRQVSACFEETDDMFSANLPNCNRLSPLILDGRCCQPQSLCVPGLYVSVFGPLRSARGSCQYRVTSPNETSRPRSESLLLSLNPCSLCLSLVCTFVSLACLLPTESRSRKKEGLSYSATLGCLYRVWSHRQSQEDCSSALGIPSV